MESPFQESPACPTLFLLPTPTLPRRGGGELEHESGSYAIVLQGFAEMWVMLSPTERETDQGCSGEHSPFRERKIATAG
jgi:hypothetical protein